jgi:hypothetical protein
MVMMSGKKGEQSDNKEARKQIDDDNNCEAVAKQTNNNNEHDRKCVVEANTGEKEGVDINDEGGKGMDNEFDIDSLYNHEYDYTDIDGTIDGTDNGMIAWEYVCDDDRKREINREIKDYNDNYNEDDGRGGGSVVNNNTANLVTIASALMNLSRGKEEESKSREETVDEIDDDGDLKPAAKPTEFILRHDKDSVNNNDEGGKGEDKEFDTLFNQNDDNTNIDREGGSGAASFNDKKMSVEHNCVDERTSVGNNKNIDNNDGYNSVDEEGRNSFADNNDGNNSTITKIGNNNSSNSEGSTNQREELSPGKLKLWYDKLSVVQQRQIEMNVNAVLYSGCMAAAPQLFDTTVRQQEADDDDDDNVVGDWNMDDDLVVGGGCCR